MMRSLLVPRRKLRLQVAFARISVTSPLLHSQDAATELAGPDSVSAQLAADDKDKPDLLEIDEQASFDEWKAGVKERTGFDFGLDYFSLGLAATDSLGDSTAASGVFRVFGTWELLNRGKENNGSLVFKFEHRHAYTNVAPLTRKPRLRATQAGDREQDFERISIPERRHRSSRPAAGATNGQPPCRASFLSR